MPIQKVPKEVNFHVKGLFTEAGPLTFPENASIEEQNFVLNKDGSRQRRLGMDVLSGNIGLGSQNVEENVYRKFEWKNAGGNSENLFLVVQYDFIIEIYNLKESSPSKLYWLNLEGVITKENDKYLAGDFTSVDGILIGTFGEHDVLRLEYDDEAGTFSEQSFNLKIRDFFGIQTPWVRTGLPAGDFGEFEWDERPERIYEDLVDEDSKVRPLVAQIPDHHIYNLRNQSWGRAIKSIKEISGSRERDPIQATISEGGFLPSNSDILSTGIAPNSAETNGPDRYDVSIMGDTPITNEAPKGFFIIDALKRGLSRRLQYSSLIDESRGAIAEIQNWATFPDDRTPFGPSCVGQYAGRVWYGGFSGKVVDGDSRSPNFSSYIMFSQLVENPKDVEKCYQKNDPTYRNEADLLATDGGFIKLDEAYNIKAFRVLGNSLLVFAENGVWSISGGSDQGFSAEAFIVSKLTEEGAIENPNIVSNGKVCFYWADTGIYSISPNEIGQYSVSNITLRTIQTYYNQIKDSSKVNAFGIYEEITNKVKWIYSDGVMGSQVKELILDLDLEAWYVNVIGMIAGESPVVLFPVARKQSDLPNNNIYTPEFYAELQERTLYFSLYTFATTKSVAFCSYNNTSYLDWWRKDNFVGVDAEAYFVTGYGPNEDFQRRKQAQYITTYMMSTEGVGTDLPDSGCLMQARWSWHNSPQGNKWGRENQIYRLTRFKFPDDEGNYDDGNLVVSTKNKVRGHGNTLSLKFKTQPNKDCHILGWSTIIDVSSNV